MASVDLTAFPASLAEQLGITLFAGQLIASGILIALFVFPTLFLSKICNLSTFIALIMAFISMGICVALSWFPIWSFAIICLLVALFYAGKFQNIAGKGE